MGMNGNPSPKLNPIQKHHRQAAWQIWLPVGLATAIFLALCILAVHLTVTDQTVGKNWAALSVIWWILPSCLGGLITLAILVGSVFGAGKALGGLPGLAGTVQQAVDRLSKNMKAFADRAASPAIKVSKWQAAAKQAWNSVTGKNKP
jgi:hypothetical protein